MQGRDHIDLVRQLTGIGRFSHRQIQERHALEMKPLRERARLLYQLRPCLHPIDMPVTQRLEIQVIQDETQIGFARAVVRQRGPTTLLR